jgi:precorrin-6B methylase 2
MTNPAGLGSGRDLTFFSPLSEERADRLAGELAAAKPETVIDIGCGWGELLLRVLAAAPQARGVGLDRHGPDMERARATAAERGLAERATFVHGEAKDHLSAADLVISSGAYQVFGSIPEALVAMRPLVNPGGRLLFACEVWERTPTAEELAQMWEGTTLDTCLYVADVADAAVAAGFRPLRIEMATRDEWDWFESGYAANSEEWLLANGDHPEAGAVRAELDKSRTRWLRGTRDVMGYVYLLLGVPA